MQMAELWRRGVVRPHATDGLENGFDENTPVDYLPIDETLFSRLWGSRLFHDLNVACGSLIDDYADEELSSTELVAGLSVIRQHVDEASLDGPDVSQFLRSLSLLLKTAIDAGTPVYFIL